MKLSRAVVCGSELKIESSFESKDHSKNVLHDQR